MATVNYNSLSSLKSVELKYNYYRDEELQSQTISYTNGYSFYSIDGLTNFQDLAINNNSCFVLTSSVSLSSIFEPSVQLKIGQISGTIKLQPRNTNVYYGYHDNINGIITLNSFIPSNFLIVPVDGQVEIRTSEYVLQVDETYPYTVRVSLTDLEKEQIHRQRFECLFEENLVTFKTQTAEGPRFLAFCNDWVLRATGLVLNETTVNDYVFKATPVTQNTTTKNFNPNNNWVTYYMDIESQANNKTTAINKDFSDVPTNFLIDFPVEEAIKTGTAVINIANLKTNYTPTGAPAPVINTYTKQIITTN